MTTKASVSQFLIFMYIKAKCISSEDRRRVEAFQNVALKSFGTQNTLSNKIVSNSNGELKYSAQFALSDVLMHDCVKVIHTLKVLLRLDFTKV